MCFVLFIVHVVGFFFAGFSFCFCFVVCGLFVGGFVGFFWGSGFVRLLNVLKLILIN